MRFEITVDIDAPRDKVWEHLVAIERWPEMTRSVSRVERLDDGPLGKGSQARVHQPKLRPAVYTVTDFEPGRSFTWESRGPGIVTTAGHILTESSGTVSARLTLTQTGPAAPVIGLLYGRLIRRYVTMEAEGLKAISQT